MKSLSQNSDVVQKTRHWARPGTGASRIPRFQGSLGNSGPWIPLAEYGHPSRDVTPYLVCVQNEAFWAEPGAREGSGLLPSRAPGAREGSGLLPSRANIRVENNELA